MDFIGNAEQKFRENIMTIVKEDGWHEDTQKEICDEMVQELNNMLRCLKGRDRSIYLRVCLCNTRELYGNFLARHV